MTLHELNQLPVTELKKELYSCCGSEAWVNRMVVFFPADDMVEILEDAEEQWYQCTETDWKEAFAQHPKIGDVETLTKKFGDTAHWASNEQSGVNTASQQTMHLLAAANAKYQSKFGYIFIVCATGKNAGEMLALLEQRLVNPPQAEISIAMDEQNKITLLRIQKLLS